MTPVATPTQLRHHAPRPALPAAHGPVQAPPKRPVDLSALHGLRIVLTLWLVVHHTTRWLLRDTGIDPDTVTLLRQGPGATTGFFILSGVVLTWRWSERLAANPTIPQAADFLRRRWAAIWPLGAIAALIAVPYELVEDRLAPGEFVVGLVANMALVQSWLPVGGGIHGMSLRFNGPTWTLSTLLALYAAFPAIVWAIEARVRTKGGVVALAVVPWLLVVGTAVAMRGEANGVWLMHVSPVTRIADFLAGVAIGTWLVRYGAPARRGAIAGQLVGLVLIAFAVWSAVPWHLGREVRFGALFIPPFALLIACLTVRGGPVGGILGTRAAQVAGKRAFAIAMLHTPLLGLGWHAGLVRLDRPAGTALVLGSSVGMAMLVHRYVEMPARSRLRVSSRRR